MFKSCQSGLTAFLSRYILQPLYRGCNGIKVCVQLQIVMDRTIIIRQHTYRFEYPITCIINRDNLMLLWYCNLICSSQRRPTEQPSIFHSRYEVSYRRDGHGSAEGVIIVSVIRCKDNIPYYFLKFVMDNFVCPCEGLFYWAISFIKISSCSWN